MGRIKRIDYPKEEFISPRITYSVGVDLEEVLLAGAGSQFTNSVVATGHERETVTDFENYSADYWETGSN